MMQSDKPEEALLPTLRAMPDAMPLREALRGMHHVLRRGGETLRETVQPGLLPAPAEHIAGVVLGGCEILARGMNDAAVGLARKVLVPVGEPRPMLQHIGTDAAFASTFYAALRSVLAHLGADRVFASEAAARRAYQQTAADPSVPDHAAALMLALLQVRVLRDASAAKAGRMHGAGADAAVVFAVLLWLQSDRPETEDDAALISAADLSVALAAEIAAACGAADAAALAVLFRDWAKHV